MHVENGLPLMWLDLPLDLRLVVVQLLEELLAFAPLGQIGITPVFHHFGQFLGIETVLKTDALQGFLGLQRTTQLALQNLNYLWGKD